MDELRCLHGINFADGTTNKLIVNRFGVMKIYNPTTSVWDNVASPTFNATANISTENFLDHAFFVNGTDSNYSYNSSGTWSTTTNLSDSPKAKFIKKHTVRLFLANIVVKSTSFRSRVWMSDLPKNNQITWGLETGTDMVTTASSAVVTSAGSSFIVRNIKVGDKLVLEEGSDAGEHVVRSVDSATQLTLTKSLTASASNIDFWVGGNYFDVNTDDGDVITGVGSNSNELLFFKNNTLHRYNLNSNTLRQVKEVPGTSASRSIVDEDEYTYYYDPSNDAIRRYTNGNATIISYAIEDIMASISSSMRTKICGWVNGSIIEFFIGDVTTRDGVDITNCVIMWDTVTETWSTRSLPFEIEVSAEWNTSSKRETYLGTSNGKVLLVNDGYKYDDKDIAFSLTDQPIFPAGRGVLVDFDKIRVYLEKSMGDITIAYKILYAPTTANGWRHAEWEYLRGRADANMVEFTFKPNKIKRGMGIQIQFIQSSGNETFLIEDYELYYSNPAIL